MVFHSPGLLIYSCCSCDETLHLLMALLAAVFWALNAALIYFGVRLPIVYLTTFNLASATYAFVDVVCDAVMVTWGRQLQRVGLFVNFQWTVLAIANIGAVFLGA
jgi:hypothetical protein